MLAGAGDPGIHLPGRRQELQAVPQADAHTVLRNFADGGVGNCDTFCGGSDAHDARDLFRVIWCGGDDEKTGQEIGRDPVSRDNIVGATNGSHAAI